MHNILHTRSFFKRDTHSLLQANDLYSLHLHIFTLNILDRDMAGAIAFVDGGSGRGSEAR